MIRDSRLGSLWPGAGDRMGKVPQPAGAARRARRGSGGAGASSTGTARYALLVGVVLHGLATRVVSISADDDRNGTGRGLTPKWAFLEIS